ncbi:hypothetical protein LXA43DRAFT_1099802 [Ganoderma leucocontextum]|nr:hypothetical protein LXA43DRAFT_1099802 [Ganoderma leucocontextum]
MRQDAPARWRTSLQTSRPHPAFAIVSGIVCRAVSVRRTPSCANHECGHKQLPGIVARRVSSVKKHTDGPQDWDTSPPDEVDDV